MSRYNKDFESTMDRLFKTLANDRSWKHMNRLDLFNVLFKDRQKEIQSLQKQIELLEGALGFYGNEKLYFQREEEVDLNKTTAVFKQDYIDNLKDKDITKPNIQSFKIYECSARIKVDQGKKARQALKELEEMRNNSTDRTN